MKLKDVQFGIKHKYYSREFKTECYVVAQHTDDGASLIIELYEDDDISGKYRMTEASELDVIGQMYTVITKVNNKGKVMCSARKTRPTDKVFARSTNYYDLWVDIVPKEEAEQMIRDAKAENGEI